MKELLIKEEWTTKKYTIGIANTQPEIDELHKLRYDIFNVELDEGIKENEVHKKDIDKFDDHCDHLIVKETSTGKIISTYRIHPSWKIHNEGFYTSTVWQSASIIFAGPNLCVSVKRGLPFFGRKNKDLPVHKLIY